MTKPHGGQAFLWLLLTQSISLVGSRLSAIGVGIWVFTRTGSATPLLLTAFFNELPGMLFGSLAGVLVDRWPRKWVLILSDAGQAVGSLLLLVSVNSGEFAIWHLYLIAFLQGSFSTFQGPAEQASITLLIPEAWRERANALREVPHPFASVLAPGLAGLLYSLVGVQGIILIDLVTFVTAASIVLLLHIPQPAKSESGQAGRGSLRGELTATFQFLLSRRPLVYFLIYGMITNFLLNGPGELTLPYLLLTTGSEKTAGFVLGVMSLGALSGALLMSVWGGTRPRIHTLIPGLLISGAMFVVFGMARSPWLLAGALFFILAPLPMSNVVNTSIMQAKVPPDLQGRFFALKDQLFFLGSTLSFALCGPLADQVMEPAVGKPGWSLVAPLVGAVPGSGIGLLEVVTGILIITITLAAYAWPVIRKLEATVPDHPQ